MPPELPPERRRFSWRRVVELLAILFFALLLIGLLFPAHTGCGHGGKRVKAKYEAEGLMIAIKQYHTEYGHFPPLNTPYIEDEFTQARLVQILRAQDQNHTLNPRRVPFFEAPQAKKQGSWREKKYGAGIHPKSGAFLDPWGRPYRVRLDADYDGKFTSPYKDEKEIFAPVLVWSLGKDGVQGSPGKENILKDSDDLVSWR